MKDAAILAADAAMDKYSTEKVRFTFFFDVAIYMCSLARMWRRI